MGEVVDLDQEHLRLLRVGFFIMAALTGSMSILSLLYIGLGGFFASQVIPLGGNDGAPRLMGFVFLAIGGAFLVLGCTVTFLAWFAGRSLGERRRWTFCIVVSALFCLQFPFGTAIGVCALMVLNRPSVKLLFEPRVLPPPLPNLPSK
jgi:hypothetical protein